MSQAYEAASDKPRDKTSNKWKWAKRAFNLFFFIAVPVLLFLLVKNLDWQEVKQALQSYKLSTLAIGVVIALCSYLTYCCFDVLARFYTGHKLRSSRSCPWRSSVTRLTSTSVPGWAVSPCVIGCIPGWGWMCPPSRAS